MFLCLWPATNIASLFQFNCVTESLYVADLNAFTYTLNMLDVYVWIAILLEMYFSMKKKYYPLQQYK